VIVFGYGFSGSLALLIGAAAVIVFGMGMWLGFQIARKGVSNVLDFGKQKTEEMA
jgi:hypothetical protein